MKHLIALAFALVVMNCVGCGGDTHESLAAEQVSTMKELVTVLDGVKDEDSAKAAKSKVKSLVEKMNDINLRESKLKPPTQEEVKAMGDKYGKEMEALAPKLQGNMLRIMTDPKVSAVLQDLDTIKPAK